MLIINKIIVRNYFYEVIALCLKLRKQIIICAGIISFSLFSNSTAQVNGISGAKLCVPEAIALSTGMFEFEPSFSVLSSENKFCEHGTLESLSGRNITSSVLFRLTAGIADNWEIGTAFSSTIEQVSLGTKYILYNSGNFSAGLIAGVSLPAGNKFISDTTAISDHHFLSSYGSIASLKLTESSSLDMMFSYTRIHSAHLYSTILNYGVGIGNWFSEKIQCVLELNGYSTYNGTLHSGKISLTPGITYKVSDQLLFVLGFQLDLIGKNEFKNFGYFSAFTITF